MSSFGIDANCVGSFVVDNEGVKSTHPVELEKEEWNGKTLALKSNQVSFNSFSMNGCTFTSNSYSSNVVMSNVGLGGSVYINGVKIDPSVYNGTKKCEDSKAKMYNKTWKDLNLENPVLSTIDISGSSSFNVKIPMNEDCDISVSGSGGVIINGDNKNTFVSATVTGSGDIKGVNSIIKKINAQVTGSGDIGGFTVDKMIKARITGSGDINLRRLSNACTVDKKVLGSGDINIY
jgi:hypothetical protein